MLNFLKNEINSPFLKKLYQLYIDKNYLQLREEIIRNLDYFTSTKGIKELKKELENDSKIAEIRFLWIILASILQEIKIENQTKENLLEVLETKKEKQQEKTEEVNKKIVLSTITELAKSLKKTDEENKKLKEKIEYLEKILEEFSQIKMLLIRENLFKGRDILTPIKKLIESYKKGNKKNKEEKNNKLKKIEKQLKEKNEQIQNLEEDLKNKNKKIEKLEKQLNSLEEQIKILKEQLNESNEKKESEGELKAKILEATKSYKEISNLK